MEAQQLEQWKIALGLLKDAYVRCVATSGLLSADLKESRNDKLTGDLQWRHTEPLFILCAVRWYLRYSLSRHDVEELLQERGLNIDHTAVWRCTNSAVKGTISL